MASLVHCVYCFDVLIESLDSKAPTPSVPFPDAAIKYPLFVTWKKRPSSSSSDWRLRGCIGTFTARELMKGLKEYALISALKDSRFAPVKKSELPLLRCDVSLLTNFEPASDVEDWEIGIHGIQIEFLIEKERFGATFLPDVAKEQRWNKQQTLEALIEKAGYEGNSKKLIEKAKNGEKSLIKVTRYQSSKASLTHDDYVIMRNNRSFLPEAIPSKNIAATASSMKGNNRNQSSSSSGSKRRADDDE